MTGTVTSRTAPARTWPPSSVRWSGSTTAAAGKAALDAVKAMTGVAGIAAVSQQDEQVLDTIYFDTADLRLIRAGITLGGAPAARTRAGT